MMLLVVISCILVAVSAQIAPPGPDTGMVHNMTHHGNGTGHHHESPEKEMWSFTFEPSSGIMVVLKDTDCYLWTITSDERSKIHTDAGLRGVEIRVVGEIEDAVYTVINGRILNPRILGSCGKHASKFFIVH